MCLGSPKHHTEEQLPSSSVLELPQPMGQSALSCVVAEDLLVVQRWTEKLSKADHYYI